MNFDFSEEQKLLQKTTRDFLEENAPLAKNRNVLESDALYDAELWKGAAEMGWQGAVIPEEYGGAGFGYLELVLIAEEIGRALAPIPFGSSAYLATEAILAAGTPEQKKSLLTRLASGDAIGTLALVESAGDPDPSGLSVRFEGGKLSGTKIAVADGSAANLAVVAATSSDGPCLAVVDLAAGGVNVEATRSIDPTRANASIRFDGASAEPLGAAGEGWQLIENVLERAAILQAFEQVGAAERAFDITREFAMGRYAFGRPIASFQALKHRFADMYVALQLARSNAFYGAWALSTEAPELSEAACNARVSACDAFDLAAVEMVQIHGGVGYTWEYDCHLFYRRAKYQTTNLGTPRFWRERLIQSLAAKTA